MPGSIIIKLLRAKDRKNFKATRGKQHLTYKNKIIAQWIFHKIPRGPERSGTVFFRCLKKSDVNSESCISESSLGNRGKLRHSQMKEKRDNRNNLFSADLSFKECLKEEAQALLRTFKDRMY